MRNGQGEDGKWSWLKEFTRVSPSSVTLLLAIAMILYAQDRGIDKILDGFVRMVVAMENVKNSLEALADATALGQTSRQHEHDQLSEQLEECKEMGKELARCQRESVKK